MKRFSIGLILSVVFITVLLVVNNISDEPNSTKITLMSILIFFCGMPAAVMSEDSLNSFERFFMSWKYKNVEDLEIAQWRIVMARIVGVFSMIIAFIIALYPLFRS